MNGHAAAHPGRHWHAVEVLRDSVPQGLALPERDWTVRHRAILFILFGHAVGLSLFGLAQGWDPVVVLSEGALLAALGLVAAMPALTRQMRSSLSAFALVVASAVLVQFSGGVIEAHFHFFIIVALITLYQDWVPFLVCIAFVALDHGLIGTLQPSWVYNHPDAIVHPWKWAAVHAVMVLAECAALIVVWRANERAREQTERVLRSAGEGIVGLDREGRVTFANPTALTMLGVGADALVGSTLGLRVSDADGKDLGAGPTLATSEATLRGEAEIDRPGHKPLPVEVVCTPMQGRAGPEGAVVALRDLTERRRAEESRLRASAQRQELEQLRREDAFKTQFLNMAAHELNTPLTPIRLQLHLLKKNATVQERPGAGSLQVLDRNFQRLSHLVQDLLDSTRLQGSHLKVVVAPVDLAAMCMETVETFRAPAEENGVRLDVDLPRSLMVQGDTMRLTQVLYNLLSNAIKFTPRGGRVLVSLAEVGDEAVVSVGDTGLGLTRAQIERLFQPFSQVHEAQTSEHRGSGLGLYIAKGILAVHGGRIWVESDGPGKGSTFLAALPTGGARPDAQAIGMAASVPATTAA